MAEVLIGKHTLWDVLELPLVVISKTPGDNLKGVASGVGDNRGRSRLSQAPDLRLEC